MFNIAKAAAYSGMLFSFPALLVLTTLLALVPEGTTLVGEVRSSLDQFLPPGSMYLLQIGAGDEALLLGAGALLRRQPEHLRRTGTDALAHGGFSPRL